IWQGGLAAGKPSVPWYQIHVRGIPGWRACRRPQARPPWVVHGNNGERSLGRTLEEAAACNAACAGLPSTFNVVTHPRAPLAQGDASVADRFLPKIGLGPRKARIVLRQDQISAGCDLGSTALTRETAAQTFA